jgi:hypothetical protein
VSLLWLLVGVCALAAAAGLAACCFRLRFAAEFLLAAYVLAWAWLVALVLALSLPRLVTRSWLLVGIGAGLVAAIAWWVGTGRPRPPSFRPAIAALREALQRPSLLVLGVAVTAGLVYSLALAFLVPVNDPDALAYHLARAAFWHQEQGLGYIAHAVDPRLNGNPPNAEIGQLATMVLSGSDRYVALPQLGTYLALVLCVAALGRRVDLDAAGALFGALAFGTLSIVVVQASSALNDLVVASFLAIAVLFALRAERTSLALVALAIGLAVGTKFTALVALPTLALVVTVARPVRSWIPIALAGLGGLVLGSAWYVTNIVETGTLDGGLSDWGDQRLEFSASTWLTNSMQWALDTIDMSGAFPPHSDVFLAAAGLLAVLALVRIRTPRRAWLGLFVAALVTVGVLLLPPLSDLGDRVLGAAWGRLRKPSGLAELWPADETHFVSRESVWGADRADVQTRLRPDEGEEFVYRYLEANVADDATISVAPRANDFLSPFFGPRLSRHVSLASRTAEVDPAAEWLILAPHADARRCRADWRRVETYGSGWRIERRVARDSCP